MVSKTSEFTEFNGNFELLNISLGVPEICGQKRPVFRPRKIGGGLKQSRLTRLSGHSASVTILLFFCTGFTRRIANSERTAPEARESEGQANWATIGRIPETNAIDRRTTSTKSKFYSLSTLLCHPNKSFLCYISSYIWRRLMFFSTRRMNFLKLWIGSHLATRIQDQWWLIILQDDDNQQK